MSRHLAPAFRMMLAMTVLTGLIYPPLVTGLCHLAFPRQANGSVIRYDGHVVGSELIGQNFTSPAYFQPRPSAVGYDASNSGGSNDGPTSSRLVERVKASIQAFRKANPAYHGPIPADLVTESASGLDPDISLASAEAQAPRVAQARRVPLPELRRFIEAHARRRRLGFLGEPMVNVLKLNLALNRTYPQISRQGHPGAAAPPAKSIREARNDSQSMVR